MSESERKPRLDNALRAVINTATPRFDAEAWQRKYRDEFDALLARARTSHGQSKPARLRPAVWLGIAATIVVVAYGLTCWTGFYRTQAPPPARVESPAELVVMSSLYSAFQRGGMEALDKQLDEAVVRLGPPPTSTLTARRLTDLGS